jgi:hypothetical protein
MKKKTITYTFISSLLYLISPAILAQANAKLDTDKLIEKILENTHSSFFDKEETTSIAFDYQNHNKTKEIQKNLEKKLKKLGEIKYTLPSNPGPLPDTAGFDEIMIHTQNKYEYYW